MQPLRAPLARSAATVAGVQWSYAQASRSLADAALAGARRYVEWEHYPRRDCIDAQRGTRFYYHAHAAAERAEGEHGHFHLFVQPLGTEAGAFSHLVGLSLDARGMPLRWFTTNRWVTGEHWLDAGSMAATLAGFEVRASGRLAPVARWLSALVALYADDLSELLHARDTRLNEHARACGLSPEAAFEDRDLHIVTQRPIDLLPRLAAVCPDASFAGDNP